MLFLPAVEQERPRRTSLMSGWPYKDKETLKPDLPPYGF
jgi:hypothetical protein